MRLTGAVQRLTVLIGEADRYHHHALSAEVLQRAHAAGLAGASVFHGVSGFGASRTVHTSHVLSLSDDLPLAIVIVDSAEKVQAFLPQLDVVENGLVLVEDVLAV
jgi:PII-like signaling protein